MNARFDFLRTDEGNTYEAEQFLAENSIASLDNIEGYNSKINENTLVLTLAFPFKDDDEHLTIFEIAKALTKTESYSKVQLNFSFADQLALPASWGPAQ